jgi:signal transduction histidine kinase
LTDTSARQSNRRFLALSRRQGLISYELAVIGVTLVVLAYLISREQNGPRASLILPWAAIVAVVVLLPIPFWRSVELGMDFPILIAAAFLFSPLTAALVAFIGSFDPRELRRQVSIGQALFNRSQVALSVLLASMTFHRLGSLHSAFGVMVGAALISAIVDYCLNTGFVALRVSLAYGLTPRAVLKKMHTGRPAEFVVSYSALAVLGMVLAHLYLEVGFWAVPVVLIPLVFARQMFFRSRALEEAHRELKERELVMRTLSNRMAEERQDERTQIAAYLHDDLAQLLFRLSLQVDLARRHLKSGDSGAAEQDLDAIRETKNRTSELVRALIRDLHRSPLGRAGLAEALVSFTSDIGEGSGVRFHADIAPMGLPPAIQLLIYHIAREAAMNALKHSGAENVWIALQPVDDGVELTVRDDGIGFDAQGPGPEGHFGLAMMRERALVAGGVFAIHSATGEGTTITVRFPATYLQDAGGPANEAPPTDQIVPVAEPAPSRSAVSA